MKYQNILAAAAAACILLTGCGSPYSKQTADLTASLKTGAEKGTPKNDDFVGAQYQFTVSLLQAVSELHPNENTLQSPYLAGQTLLMAANGTAGGTKDEIMQLFGGMDTDTLNSSYCGWRLSMPTEQFRSASSVRIKDDALFSPDDISSSYLQTMKDFFSAEIYTAAFDDTTVSDMNQWVNTKTEGEIPALIDALDPLEVMLLFGTGVFDAQWSDPYADNEVRNALFFGADGSQKSVPFLRKEMENAVYLEDQNAVGLMRNYQNGRYAFAALMPREITLDEYIAQLDAEQLRDVLNSGLQTEVDTMIPKFTNTQDMDLKPVFQKMGILSAYAEGADFSAMTERPVYMNRTVQKAQIEVNEGGTKASFALTIGEEESCCAEHSVTLCKPFLYLIYDREYGLPVLMGTVQTFD